MQHNVTIGGPDGDTENSDGDEPAVPKTFFTYGIRDLFTIFFYCLIAIVLHAILQEYIIDVSSQEYIYIYHCFIFHFLIRFDPR